MYYETIQIDFNSDEAIYIQLRNQIILGIATSRIQEGDTLPSVRQLADNIGINMHTVIRPTAYSGRRGFFRLTEEKEPLSLSMRINCMPCRNCAKICR